MKWTRIACPEAETAALALCRGTYQRDLVLGCESLSGSTLKGAAKKFGGKYARSRADLLARMTAGGVKWSEEKGERGARILVIGA
jgi:hypothetical protein